MWHILEEFCSSYNTWVIPFSKNKELIHDPVPLTNNEINSSICYSKKESISENAP